MSLRGDCEGSPCYQLAPHAVHMLTIAPRTQCLSQNLLEARASALPEQSSRRIMANRVCVGLV